jgi:type I restriction enzyme, S subunit
MSEWKEYSLKDLGFIITGKTPSKKNPEDWGFEMPFITPSDFKNYRKKAIKSERNLAREGILKLKNKILPIKSILVTCIGSDMGKVVLNATEAITNQQINSIIPNANIADNDFLYYRLVSMYEILRIYGGDGTAVPIVNKSDFENLKTNLPSLPEQKAIAEVLSSLDDKIDLLHRQNKTLEQMAETLFRQWFVEEADESWEEKPLQDFVDIAIGRTPPRKQNQWFSTNDEDVKWISIKDMGNDGVYIFNTSEYLTKEAVERFNIPLIPINTVVLSFKMTLGRVKITSENMLSNEAIAHFKFREDTSFTKEYLYLFLKMFPYEILGSTSSIVTSINSKMIKELRILIPDEKIINEFKEKTESNFEKIRSNQIQIHTLEKIRDTLLPKLMSGDVKIDY